ncbi:tyrosine-type recombinase/integrase [Streptomyces europaeiscabiei]|uniref:tyrosine-type recombinase/integrase n=1 Tax=Streptomyces europaeiscabiei TaxID=146819 RepID=UPI0029A7CB0B|nr:tyrosine-type recombinase/integrase [Streptomyces europaeiscabiei]MDX3666965.1 tyrosine-type recombinase/integrase [Streptomyces europaeiscabiei]
MAGIREVARKSGVAFEVRWTDGGRDVQMTCPTLKAAEREKLRIEDELAQGRSTLWRVEKRTVAQVVEACIAADAARLKPRTTEGARSIAKKHIVPAFGQRRIGSLRARDVERWIEKVSKTHAPGTVRTFYNVLNKAMKYAIRHEWLVVNPCTGVALPKDNSEIVEDRYFLTPQQVQILAAALSEKEQWYGLLVRVAAYTGLRAGELAALRVRDIDMMHGEVQVRRTVRRGKGGEWLFTAPKSKKSVRNVPLPGFLKAELREWLAAHPDGTNPDAQLWPGSRNTGKGGAVDWSRRFDINNFAKRYLRPALRSGALAPAGIPVGLRWHDLRHTYASIMAAVGGEVTVYDISKWLGHSSISVTEKVYVHLFRQDNTGKMSAVDAFLGGAGQGLGHVAPVTALRGVVGGS